MSYGGKSASVRVVDLCPGCPHGALDASPTVFRHLVGSLGPGVVNVQWNWGGCGSSGSSSSSTSSRRSSSSTSSRTSSSSTSSRTSTSSAQDSEETDISSTTIPSFLALSQRTACYNTN